MRYWGRCGRALPRAEPQRRSLMRRLTRRGRGGGGSGCREEVRRMAIRRLLRDGKNAPRDSTGSSPVLLFGGLDHFPKFRWVYERYAGGELTEPLGFRCVYGSESE